MTYANLWGFQVTLQPLGWQDDELMDVLYSRRDVFYFAKKSRGSCAKAKGKFHCCENTNNNRP